MPDAIQARAAALRLEATRRWLVKDELIFLLLHYKLSGVPILRTLHARPPSGSLMVYDTQAVPEYKKDGWRWQKRKDKSGRVREDRAKLVINRAVIILGSYVHSADTATFHRRSYYLRDSNQSIVLVHYFDEVHKQQLGGHPSRALAPPLPHFPEEIDVSKVPSLPGVDAAVQSQEESVDAVMKKCFALDYSHTATGQTQQVPTSSSGDQDIDMIMKDGITPDFVDDVLYNDAPVSSTESVLADKRANISDFSPDWDFVEGGAKVLICLTSSLPVPNGCNASWPLFVQFGRSRTPAEQLSETVLRCTAPQLTAAGVVDIFVCRCKDLQANDRIMLTEAKRFVYRSHEELSPVQAPASEPRSTDYKDQPLLPLSTTVGGAKRGRSPNGFALLAQRNRTADKTAYGGFMANLSSYVEAGLDERQCKIRVVERLSEFHQAIWTNSSATDSHRDDSVDSMPRPIDQAATASIVDSASSLNEADSEPPTCTTNEESAALDDNTIEKLSDHDLEVLSEKLLEQVVRQLIALAHSSDELLEELNSLDETGLSLLHYVSFYNYAQLVPVLLAHGAHVNQQSTQGQTALHLAAGCGHDNLVAVLLQSGADSQVLDFDGLTAADRAEKSGHAEVANTLRCHMSETGNTGSVGTASPDPLFELSESYSMDIDDDPTLYQDCGQMIPMPLDIQSPWPSSTARPHAESADHATKSTVHCQADENHEHNRKFLLGAFSTLSLHDKCALSLSISRDGGGSSRRRGSSVSDETASVANGTASSINSSPAPSADPGCFSTGELSDSIYDSDVKSVIAEDEASLNKLEAAIELMGPEERQSLEEEVTVLQHNIRAWLLRRNCKSMREATKRLHEATKSIEGQHQLQDHADSITASTPDSERAWDRERAAVTLQAATRSILARKNFLQTKHVAIKVQAATRGVLCRKHFARMKAQAQASLVIQRNVREWWHKQPSGGGEASEPVPPSDKLEQSDVDMTSELV